MFSYKTPSFRARHHNIWFYSRFYWDHASPQGCIIEYYSYFHTRFSKVYEGAVDEIKYIDCLSSTLIPEFSACSKEASQPTVSLKYTRWGNYSVSISASFLTGGTLDATVDTGSIPTTISHTNINFEDSSLHYIIGCRDNYDTLDSLGHRSILARGNFQMQTNSGECMTCNNCHFFINSNDYANMIGASPGKTTFNNQKIPTTQPHTVEVQSIFAQLKYNTMILDGNTSTPNLTFYNDASTLKNNFTFFNTSTDKNVCEIKEPNIQIVVNGDKTYSPSQILLDTGSGDNYIYLDDGNAIKNNDIYMKCEDTCTKTWFKGCSYINNENTQIQIKIGSETITTFTSQSPDENIHQKSLFVCPHSVRPFNIQGAALSPYLFTQMRVAYFYNDSSDTPKHIAIEIKPNSI